MAKVDFVYPECKYMPEAGLAYEYCEMCGAEETPNYFTLITDDPDDIEVLMVCKDCAGIPCAT